VSLRDTINDLGNGPFTVTRRAAPVIVKGIATASSDVTTFEVEGGWQPATGRDAANFPEGVRTVDMRILYLLDEVMPERPGYVADVVTIGGEDYSVATSRQWIDPDGEAFWIAHVARGAIT